MRCYGIQVRMHVAQTEHATLGRVNYAVRELGPWPDQQVARTVDVMNARVIEDAAGDQFKERARSVVGGARTQLDQVGRIHQHARNSIRFARDEAVAGGIGGINADQVVEVIIRPVDMAAYIDQGIAVGDCDDFSMYVAALLTAVGVKCAFVTVAADGQAPDQYSHVYVVAYPVDESTGQCARVACDASHGSYPGWEVPNTYGKLKEWAVGAGGGDSGGGFAAMVMASLVGTFGAWWLWKRLGRMSA